MITQQTNGNLLLNSNPNPSTTTTTTNSTTTPVLSPSSNYNSSTSIIQQQQHSTTTSPSITQQQLQLNHLLTPTTLAAIPSPYHATYKDTRWLTLEVCREFQRNKCNRSENECKFAHPPAHVEVTNGKVIACYDSLKSKCTRKEPPCKYLHPPQHLKDQLLQNGKNNLVLKQVAIAMMQQQTLQQQAQVQVHQVQQQQQQQQTHLHAHPLHHASAAAHVNTQAILAAAAGQTQYSPYHSNHNANQAIYNTIPGLSNGAIAAYQHVQMTSPNGQTTLVPIVTNGFHATGLQMQPGAIYADPSALLSHVTTASSTPNGLLPPHQRTDRLAQYSQQLNAAAFIANQNHDDSQLNGTYQIDSNGTYTFQPQYQILTPIYQQQQQHKNSNTSQTNTTTASTTNTNNNNNNNSTTSTSTTNITNSNSNTNGNNNSQNNLNEEAAASSPATANATANLGDVIVTTSKKRSHDAIEIEYLPLQQHLYNAQLSSKRAALADSKTGLPVFQPYHTNATAHQLHALQLQQQQQQQQITIPSQYATNLTAASFPAHLQQFTMQYAPYPGATPTFSIPYTGNATSVPRL